MEISWHGNTCFTVKDKGIAVVINPDKSAGKLSGDVVLSSLSETIKIDGDPIVFDWPGEYEVKSVPIIGFQAWTKSKSKEEDEGTAGDPTIIFYFEVNGVKFCHLGDLGHVLTSETVKQVGDVDILMINGGKDGNLGNKKAVEVLEAIDPRVVMPMGDGEHNGLLKELGASEVENLDKFILKSSSELPDDKRKFVVLKKS
jgi:L-ascorbate metabolism protein UlaG (beta-lactamase superfamily)